MSNVTNSTTLPIDIFDDPIFFIYMAGMVLCIPAFVLQVTILAQIYRYRLKDLSANLIINIILWCVDLSSSILISLYVMWNLESTQKETYIIFFGGGFFAAANQALFISVFFLCLDRVFAMSFSTVYKYYRKHFIITTIVCCSIGFLIYVGALLILEFPYQTRYTACKSMSCLATHTSSVAFFHLYRSSVSILNVCVSMIFVLMLLRHITSGVVSEATKSQFKRANNVVYVAASTELFFTVGPQFIGYICGLLNISLVPVGPLISSFGSIDAMVTALLLSYVLLGSFYREQFRWFLALTYRYIILRRMGNTKVTTIQTLASSSTRGGY